MPYGSDHLASGGREWKKRVVREIVGLGKNRNQIAKINFCLPNVRTGNLPQGLSKKSEIWNAFPVLKQLLSNFLAELCLT